MLFRLVVSVEVGQPLVVLDSGDLGYSGEAVEHLPAELVRSGHEVFEQPMERVALTRIDRDEVEEEDVSMLTDAVDPPHALLKPYE